MANKFRVILATLVGVFLLVGGLILGLAPQVISETAWWNERVDWMTPVECKNDMGEYDPARESCMSGRGDRAIVEWVKSIENPPRDYAFSPFSCELVAYLAMLTLLPAVAIALGVAVIGKVTLRILGKSRMKSIGHDLAARLSELDKDVVRAFDDAVLFYHFLESCFERFGRGRWRTWQSSETQLRMRQSPLVVRQRARRARLARKKSSNQ